MADNNQDIRDRLQQLRQQYADKLPERIAVLQQAWQNLSLENPQSPELENLIREFHKLAGSGSSYGFPVVTDLSRQIENILRNSMSGDSPDLQQIEDEINSKLYELTTAINQQ